MEQHGDYLFKFALTRLRDPAKAEDLVQETFLAALKGGDKFAGRSAEKSWLAGILKHKILGDVAPDAHGLAVLPRNELVWKADVKLIKSLASALKAGFRALVPTCRDASRLQSDALDQALPLPKRFGLRVHLLVCKWCRRYGNQIRFLRQAAHEHPDAVNEASPSTLSPDARERLKRTLGKKSN